MTDDNDVRDRLRRRFDDDDSTKEGKEQNQKTSKRSRNAKTSKNEMNTKNEMLAENVKKEWSATSVYLPEFLKRQLTTRYKHLDLAFEEAYGHSLQKTRYYYPLVIALGVECLEEMEPSEVQERIERLERGAEQ